MEVVVGGMDYSHRDEDTLDEANFVANFMTT